MNRIPFNELIVESLQIKDIEIKKIEYKREQNALSILLNSRSFIPSKNIEKLKKNLGLTLSEINHFEIGVETIASHQHGEIDISEHWENILYVIKRNNPAVASILRKSKIDFSKNQIHIVFEDQGLENTFHQYNTSELIDKICQKNLNQKFKVATSALKSDIEGLEAFEKMKNEEIEAIVQSATAAFDEEKLRRPEAPRASSGGKKSDKPSGVLFRNRIKRNISMIEEIVQEEEVYAIEGKVITTDSRELKGGKYLYKVFVSDGTNAICCKQFLKKNEYEELSERIEKGLWFLIEGINRYDQFDKERVLQFTAINEGKKEEKRMDHSEEKRVELHLHTNMSEMDGITSVKKIINTAIEWGHPAIAITDHGVLQAFPDAASCAGDKIKVIYGLEGYLIDDETELIKDANEYSLDDSFVVFDIETTGFSYNNHKIIEIGAVKIKEGGVIERFSELINPECIIPQHIIELTGINNDMVRDQQTIDVILPRFMDFIGDCPVVAHNATFDVSFIRYNCEQLSLPFNNLVLDTLALSRLLLTAIKRHNLKAITKHLKITLNDHHRAVADAEATGRVFTKFIEMLKEKNVNDLIGINYLASKEMSFKMMDMSHVILLAKNMQGLRNLYEIVSESSLKTFYRKPRILKSTLRAKREGLILGSACESGELYKAIMNNKEPEIVKEIADFYDYLEIQPTGNNAFMIESGKVRDHKELEAINLRILDLGDQLEKPVVATCDVHFLDPEDEVYRRILMSGNGFKDADNQAPLFLRTTEEMMTEFSYLGSRTKELVIDNPRKIADSCENILPVPKGTFPPKIDGADEEFREMCMNKAERIYGVPLPEIVEKRIDRELTSIIGNGYAVMYIIAQKLVKKSLDDGFLVGSRGSVGSSFAATMSDITEVNPLPPHYICGECKYSEFDTSGTYSAGVDMPDKVCPKCGAKLIKEGHDIPFETFLGFDGDKEPDIDLNFAGVYQANSHKYCEVLFGEGKTFKAGTIGTIAEKTAYGYVKKYFEERNQEVHRYEIERLAQGLTGIKRTSGQHPGGIMVVPRDHDIHEFCPVQYPANDVNSDVITTHFDYHSISGRLLKLDILGHDVPTIIKQLEELTGVNVFDISLDDKGTMEIFHSTDSLNIVDETYSLDIGSLGIPEFGTKFVRQMLRDTDPRTFSDLVRISGLSHGTDVWVNNAQDLVRNNVVTIKDVIATRDDIMNYLLMQGLEPLTSFKIMEKVRKGKGLTEEDIADMKAKNVPDWYINSCQTIQYMFPKAHAVAYVMMSVRIAYFKVHHPLAFYATYFSIKVDDFDAELICKGKSEVRAKMKELEGIEKPTKKELDLAGILEIADEFYSRGFEFKKVNLLESDAEKFKISDNKILPPFLALQGVGASAAINIQEVRKTITDFLSIEDFQSKTKVSKTVIEAMKTHGCFDGMPDDNQLSLFSFA